MLASLVFSSLVFTAPASADELYPAAPPKDAAFVRGIQASAQATTGPAKVGDKDLGKVEFGDITPYVVVSGGQHATALGGVSGTLDYSAGEFYTVVAHGSELKLIQDPRSTSLAKANIYLYNFTDQAGAKLGTGDGKVEVITGVGPWAQGDRAVNALTTDLAVWIGDTQIATFPAVTLERSRAYSAVITSAPDGPKAVWVTNSTR